MMIGLYAKAVVAALIAPLMTTITSLEDGSLTSGEIVAVVLAFLANLFLVWRVGNQQAGWLRYAKTITAGAVAFAASLGATLTDGSWPTTTEWLTIVLAALLTAVPTAIAPNARVSDSLATEQVPLA
jgi:putative flippase GtrA